MARVYKPLYYNNIDDDIPIGKQSSTLDMAPSLDSSGVREGLGWNPHILNMFHNPAIEFINPIDPMKPTLRSRPLVRLESLTGKTRLDANPNIKLNGAGIFTYRTG